MIRVLLLNILLLFLPTLLYLGYVQLIRQFQPEDQPLPNAPFVWLAVAGAVLMVIGLVVLGNWEDVPSDGKYYPPEIRDGKIVPGHVDRAK